MDDLNPYPLRVFQTAARLGSFSRAAEALFMTQPADSAHVRQLERRFGLRLFRQAGRRLVLTEAGHRLLAYADELFRLLAAVETGMRALRTLEAGSLRVVADTTAGAYIVPHYLGRFHRLHPGVEVTLQVANRAAVEAALRDMQADLGVLGHVPDGTGLVQDPFLANPLVAVGPPDHPWADPRGPRWATAGELPGPPDPAKASPGATLAALLQAPLLVREPGSGTRAALERAAGEAGSRVRPILELGSNAALKEAVAAGLGVAVLSWYAVRHEVAAGRLSVLAVAGLPLERHWYVACPRGPLSPAAAAFRTLLLEPGQRPGRG